ncbi:MAG: SAM-dependent methyltransferase [Deltaproteobacteria bacterium]|nr:SAM-dependent methyltransferase [Deltaproteobacteria bacterium]
MHSHHKKGLTTLTPAEILTICQHVFLPETEAKFCKYVSKETIANQGYNLTPARYFEIDAPSTIHRPLKDIADDINRITREKNVLKLTLNETFAKQKGLDKVWTDMKEGNKITETQNKEKLYHDLGIKFEYDNFITLSKSREIKIENADKEIMSDILECVYLPWAQHIRYLNDVQNKYLAEMRDALLPKVISGELKVYGVEPETEGDNP